MIQKFRRKINILPLKKVNKSNNCFFVTICVQDRKCIMGDIENGQINLSSTGKIIEETWLGLIDAFENIDLEDFVIMPNHFHGIITFLDTPVSKFNSKESNLSKIIKYFKAKSTLKIKECIVEEKLVFPESDNHNFNNGEKSSSNNGELKFASTQYLIQNYGTIWQKSFYDRVIRNEKEFIAYQEYIQNNVLKWELDLLNPKNTDKFEKSVNKKRSIIVNK